tara:strand:+ start:134 stop:754 length:621 start_codon:yes stop_codon:yes gene_type:complete
MPLNIQEILDQLEANQTPEEALAAGLAGTEKVAEETTDATPAAETVKTAEDASETSEQEKFAAELDAQGRIIARSFMDELNKIAVMDAPMTINTGAEGNNPGVEVSRGEVNQEQVDKVVGVLGQLNAATNAGMGEIANPAGVLSVEQKTPVDEHPVVADQAAAQNAQAAGGVYAPGALNSARGEYAKQGSAEVVTTLYNRFFGEDE